jgi:hypothetical protein
MAGALWLKRSETVPSARSRCLGRDRLAIELPREWRGIETPPRFVLWQGRLATVLPDFRSKFCEVARVAVEFLRQSLDDRLRRRHLAVDHPKQLHRVHAQLRTELEYIRTPGHAKVSDVGAEPVWFRGHGHGGIIMGASHRRRNCAYCPGVLDLKDGDDVGPTFPDGASFFLG